MSGAAATMNLAFCTRCTQRCWGQEIKRKKHERWFKQCSIRGNQRGTFQSLQGWEIIPSLVSTSKTTTFTWTQFWSACSCGNHIFFFSTCLLPLVRFLLDRRLHERNFKWCVQTFGETSGSCFFFHFSFFHSSARWLGSAPLCSHIADFFQNAYDEAFTSSPRTSLKAKGYDKKRQPCKTTPALD